MRERGKQFLMMLTGINGDEGVSSFNFANELILSSQLSVSVLSSQLMLCYKIN